MREEWHSAIHLLKVVINHNRSTHGQNLESVNDIVHSWMIFFLTSCNNPFVLGWGIGHDMGSLQARQVTNQKQASRVTRGYKPDASKERDRLQTGRELRERLRTGRELMELRELGEKGSKSEESWERHQNCGLWGCSAGMWFWLLLLGDFTTMSASNRLSSALYAPKIVIKHSSTSTLFASVRCCWMASDEESSRFCATNLWKGGVMRIWTLGRSERDGFNSAVCSLLQLRSVAQPPAHTLLSNSSLVFICRM